MKIPVEWLKEYINTHKSAKEIAESFTALGLMLDKPIEYYEAKSGVLKHYKTEILDLEHRMDRSDWLGIIGCARDLCAFENKELIYPPGHKEKGKEPTPDQRIKIEIKCPDVVNRFNTRVFRNIKVRQSPDWLKNRLEAYGIPSINNIVDITNFVMVEYGQPMHAQDLAKMAAQEIVIRKAREGETVTTLLGETIELSPDQFVLTQNDKPTVIGGIVGGETTGVDETTTDIVLDAGNYNQNNVRRSSRQLKIQNETVLRYDKFLHPELTQKAIERATYLILEIAGGDYYENYDWYPKNHPEKEMVLRYVRIEKVGGITLEVDKIKSILGHLEYDVIEETEDGLRLKVPYFRTDVVVEDDIVADILRINDYEKIPIERIPNAPPKEITPEIYDFENKLRGLMVNMGFHEHITDPLVAKNPEDIKQVELVNALTSEKSALRTSIMQTLEPIIRTYEKHGFYEIKLFEVGKNYLLMGDAKKYESYAEQRVMHAYNNCQKLSVYENSNQLKSYLSTLFENLGIFEYTLNLSETNDKTAEISVINDGKTSLVGKLTTSELIVYTTELLPHTKDLPAKRVVTSLENTTKEDLSLIVDVDMSFGPVFEYIRTFNNAIVGVQVVEEYVGPEVGENKKSVMLKVTYNNSNVNTIRSRLLETLAKNFDVSIRE